MLAGRGMLPLWAAAAAVFAGAVGVDQMWFWLARRARTNKWVRSVSKRPAFARALDLLERRPTGFLLLFRFAYGLRSVAPVVIGLSRVRVRLFMTLDIVAAAVWTALFTALGYLAGPLFAHLSGRFGTAIEIGALALSMAVLAYSLRKGSSGRPPAESQRPQSLFCLPRGDGHTSNRQQRRRRHGPCRHNGRRRRRPRRPSGSPWPARASSPPGRPMQRR
jgi:membrane protein DedA with SNARE-associated domain